MKKVKTGIGLLLLCVALAGWWQFSSAPAQELVLYGNVDYRQVDLTFLDAERLAAVLVEEGAQVQKGQVLARLETRRLADRMAVAEAQVATAQAALMRLRNGTRPEDIEQARAVVAAAVAELAFAESQHSRVMSLWQQSRGKAIQKQEVDEALRYLDVARARLTQERQRLRLAEIGPRAEDIAEAAARVEQCTRELAQLRHLMEDAELKSPAAGVISRRLLEPGDLASPQKTVLSLAVLSPKWVRAYVSEAELGRIRPGMAAAVHIDSQPEAVLGTVGFIASVAEFTPKTVQTPELRTSLVYEVRVMVEDPHNVLRLGMPATVRFPERAADVSGRP